MDTPIGCKTGYILHHDERGMDFRDKPEELEDQIVIGILSTDLTVPCSDR